MDFSAFAADDFDVVKWVNSAVEHAEAAARTAAAASPSPSSPRGGPDHEAHLSTQVMKLQLLSQDLNSSIAYSMNQLIGLLPSATRGIGEMQAKLDGLQESLKGVESVLDDSSSPGASAGGADDDGASASIRHLEQLDAVKHNMTRCSDRLREAANWKKQLREAQRTLLHTPAGAVTPATLSAVARLVESLARSQAVLRDMPGGESRAETFAALQRKFRAQLDAQLRNALRAVVAADQGSGGSSSGGAAASSSSSPASSSSSRGNRPVQSLPSSVARADAAGAAGIDVFVQIFERLGWSADLYEAYAEAVCAARLDALWSKHAAALTKHATGAGSGAVGSSGGGSGGHGDLFSARQRAAGDRRALGTYLRGVLITVRRECESGAPRHFGTGTVASAAVGRAVLRCAARAVAERLAELLPASSVSAWSSSAKAATTTTTTTVAASTSSTKQLAVAAAAVEGGGLDDHYHLELLRGYLEETSVFAAGLVRRVAVARRPAAVAAAGVHVPTGSGRAGGAGPGTDGASAEDETHKLLAVLAAPFAVDGPAMAVREASCIEAQVEALGLDSLLQSGAVAGGNKTVYLDAVNRVEHCSAVLLRDVELSAGRCFAVTQGLGAAALVAAVERIIPRYAGAVVKAVLRQLRTAAGVDQHRGGGAAAFASKAAVAQKAQAQAQRAERKRRAAQAQDSATSVDDLFSVNDGEDDDYYGGDDEDGIDQALFGAFSDWSFLQGANQLLHHCSSMLSRVASAEHVLLQLIDSHKAVYFGAARLPLGPATPAAAAVPAPAPAAVGSGDRRASGNQDSQLLGLFIARTKLADDRAQREELQVLWQQTHAAAAAAEVAARGGWGSTAAPGVAAAVAPAPAASGVVLLKASAAAFRDLVSDVRAFCFDIVCLPVDECMAEIASKILEGGDNGGDELSARYSCSVSSETRKLEEYTLNLTEQFNSLFFGDDSGANARATLDSVWASAERQWELLALRLNVAQGFASLKSDIEAAWEAAATTSRGDAGAAAAAAAGAAVHRHHHNHDHRGRDVDGTVRDRIWLPAVAHYVMSSFLAEVLRLPARGLGDRARLQVVADMTYLDTHLATYLHSVPHPAWVEALACLRLPARDALEARAHEAEQAVAAAAGGGGGDGGSAAAARAHVTAAVLRVWQ